MEKINGISRAVKPGTVVAIPRQGDVTPNLVAAGAFGHGTQIQVCSPEAGGEVSATVSLGAGANGFPVATLSEAQRLLACATTIGEIQKVESLAQLAVEFAKRARLGRAAINAAARIALDARRKAGSSLKTMIERGELAGPGKPKISHRAILHTLGDLGISPSQSSLYQQEASVPADVYEAWVRRVVESKDRVLSAKGLRALGRRRYEESGECDDPPLPFAAAASRIRRLLAKLGKQMDGDGRAGLPGLLRSLSGECEAECAGQL